MDYCMRYLTNWYCTIEAACSVLNWLTCEFEYIYDESIGHNVRAASRKRKEDDMVLGSAGYHTYAVCYYATKLDAKSASASLKDGK